MFRERRSLYYFPFISKCKGDKNPFKQPAHAVQNIETFHRPCTGFLKAWKIHFANIKAYNNCFMTHPKPNYSSYNPFGFDLCQCNNHFHLFVPNVYLNWQYLNSKYILLTYI